MVITKLNTANLIPNKVAPRYIEEGKPKVMKKNKKNHSQVLTGKSLIMNTEQ